MSIEDRVDAVRIRFDAWQKNVEDYFDRVIELLRQVTALLNEVIIGLTRIVVAFIVFGWKLSKEVLLLFFLIFPFLLIILLGVEIGGTLGFILELICGIIVCGLLIFLLVTSFVKIEATAPRQDRRVDRTKVIFVAVVMNILVLGLYVVLSVFFIPQSSLFRPVYTTYSNVVARITGFRLVSSVAVNPGEDLFTYFRVTTGEKVWFKSTAPLRVTIVSPDGDFVWLPTIQGDTMLLAPRTGTIQFEGLDERSVAGIGVLEASSISNER